MINIKTLSFPIFHRILLTFRVVAHLCTLPRYQSKETKSLNISGPRVGIEPTIYPIYSHALVPMHHDWPQIT